MALRQSPHAADRQFEALTQLASTFRGNYKTAEEMAQTFIRESILRGIYRPGEKLNQDNIATALGVSHIPVRAGLRQLEAEGLLDIKPHKGATVSVLTPDEIREIYELRELIECWLLDKAMPRMTPEVIGELRELAEDFDKADWTASGDLEPRRRFYRMLYAPAECPRSVRMVEQLRDEVGRYLLLHRADDHAVHSTLLELIANGDRQGAQRWLSQHLREVSTEIQALLRASLDDEDTGRTAHR